MNETNDATSSNMLLKPSIKNGCRSWRDGSVVQKMNCSCSSPKLSSQHPYQAAYNHQKLWVQGIWIPFLNLMTCCTHMYTYPCTNTQMHTIKEMGLTWEVQRMIIFLNFSFGKSFHSIIGLSSNSSPYRKPRKMISFLLVVGRLWGRFVSTQIW